MKLLIYLAYLFLFICSNPCKAETLYPGFHSLDQVIQFETSQILDPPYEDPEFLSQIYLSRGESYLLCGKKSLAYDDFKHGYAFADLSPEEVKQSLHFRALFGLAIIYGSEDMIEEFYLAAESLKSILSSYTCHCIQEHPPHSALKAIPSHVYANKPILGPDHVSIGDCIEFATSTADKCYELISFITKPAAQVTLRILIKDLEKRAIHWQGWGCLESLPSTYC
ncbi:MAG: hypothetical protein EB051_04975 [Chlamydiia bacterium]|nr:hypothetical protein [Chlamydiia bacterium]